MKPQSLSNPNLPNANEIYPHMPNNEVPSGAPDISNEGPKPKKPSFKKYAWIAGALLIIYIAYTSTYGSTRSIQYRYLQSIKFPSYMTVDYSAGVSLCFDNECTPPSITVRFDIPMSQAVNDVQASLKSQGFTVQETNQKAGQTYEEPPDGSAPGTGPHLASITLYDGRFLSPNPAKNCSVISYVGQSNLNTLQFGCYQ